MKRASTVIMVQIFLFLCVNVLNDNNKLSSINGLIHKIGVAIPFTKVVRSH